MNVGDNVSIKVRNPLWPARDRYAQLIPEFNYYTGTIVPTLRGFGNDVVCISTGQKQFPVRVIDRDRIVGLDAAESKEINFESWVVIGSKGSKYNVTKNDKHFECSCPSYQFRRSCKHINELKSRLAA